MNHLIELAEILAGNPDFVYQQPGTETRYRFNEWTDILHYTAQATGYEYRIQVRGEIVYYPKTLLSGTVSATRNGAVIYSSIEGEQETARAFYGGATVAGYDTQVIRNIADRFFVSREDYAKTLWNKWTMGA